MDDTTDLHGYSSDIPDGRHIYMPPTESPSKIVAITGAGIRQQESEGFWERPEGYDSYLLAYFHEPVVLGWDSGEESLPAGTLILWAPHMRQYYGSNSPWSHTWLSFSGNLAEHILGGARLSLNRPYISEVSCELCQRYCFLFYNELTRHNPPSQTILEGLLQLFIHELERALTVEENPVIPSHFVELRRFLEQNLQTPPALAQMAKRVHLSSSRFSELFRTYFGTSPVRFVNQLRMRRAAVLLCDQSRSIARIAEEVGFADPLHFSRRFRQFHGLTATALRESMLSPEPST